jgi:hypothetical protein
MACQAIVGRALHLRCSTQEVLSTHACIVNLLAVADKGNACRRPNRKPARSQRPLPRPVLSSRAEPKVRSDDP